MVTVLKSLAVLLLVMTRQVEFRSEALKVFACLDRTVCSQAISHRGCCWTQSGAVLKPLWSSVSFVGRFFAAVQTEDRFRGSLYGCRLM